MLPTGFKEIVIQLLSAPGSSASVERVFSKFGLIHSKLRNRLGIKKVTKLVLYYKMLRDLSKQKYLLYVMDKCKM